MRRFLSVIFLISIILLIKVNGATSESYERAYFPMNSLNIVEKYSNDSFKLSGGKIYAPFTGVVKRIENNAVWIESTNPICLANNRIMYVTMLIMNGNCLQDLQKGKVIVQGDALYESKDGVHIEIASGIYTTSNWTQQNNVWTQGEGLIPSDVFWITQLTELVDNKGYTFKTFDMFDSMRLGLFPTVYFMETKNMLISPIYNMKDSLNYKENKLTTSLNEENTPRCMLHDMGNGFYKISINNMFLKVDGYNLLVEFGEGSLYKVRKHTRGYVISSSKNENLVLTYVTSDVDSNSKVVLEQYRGTTNQLWAFNEKSTPAFTSILLNTQPYKTKFKSSEQITIDGLTLKEIYNDGTYLVLSDSFEFIEEEKRIVVKHKNKTVYVPITKEKTDEYELVILEKPDKLFYIEGENLISEGLKVALKYSDGKTEIIDDFIIMRHDLKGEGLHTITVTSHRKSATFDVLVIKKEIHSIEIKTLPDTEYYIYDKLNTEGLQLIVNYTDGTSGVVNKDFNCIPIVFKKTGKHMVTVTYADKETNYEVNVLPIEVTGIKIRKYPDRLIYGLGEDLDTYGLFLTVCFNNGSEAIKKTGYEVTGFDSKTAGEKTLIVSYAGKIETFNVSVIDSKLKGIEICNYPVKTLFSTYDEIDATGLTINLLYENGNVINIQNGFDILYDSLSAGYNEINVAYKGYSAKYKVLLTEKEIVNIGILKYPNRLHYRMFEELNIEGLKLKAYYNDGSVAVITTGFDVSYDFINDSKVTVTYKGFKTEFDVNLLYDEPDGLNVIYNRHIAYLDKPFSKDLLKVSAYFYEGYAYYIDDYDIEYSPQQEGIYNINISYGALKETVKVAVIYNRIIKISVVSYPESKTYKPGDELNTDGIVLKATYHDGSEEYIYDGFECIYDFSKSDKVLIRYMDFETYFKVPVKKDRTFISQGRDAKKLIFILIIVIITIACFLIYLSKKLIMKHIEKSVKF